MEKLKGGPVTDEMIQEWADEAEKGYESSRREQWQAFSHPERQERTLTADRMWLHLWL